MEALAGLGIAANVMQVIAFTRETVSLYGRVHRAHTLDPDLAARASKIHDLGDELKDNLTQVRPVLLKSSHISVNSRLPNLCSEVVATAKELSAKLKQPGSSRRTAWKITLKIAFAGSNEIDRLDKKLHQLEQTLQTELLSSIWSKQDAISIQQSENFHKLGQDIQDMVCGFAKGQVAIQYILHKEQTGLIASISSNLRTAMSQETGKTIKHISRVAQMTISHNERQIQRIRLLDSVRFPSRNARRSAIAKAHEETFEWIFQAPDDDTGARFRQWVISDSKSVFWVQGKPGAGKSMLMKFMTTSEHTQVLLKSKYASHHVYSHFIWMADSAVDATYRGLLCSLIHQILEVDVNDYIIDHLMRTDGLFFSHRNPNDWEIEDLEAMLKLILSLHKGFVLVFIDGLDEMQNKESKFRFTEFARDIFSSPQMRKICISSRPEPLEKLLLSDTPTIELHKLTKHDQEKVARDNLAKNFKLAMRDITKEDEERLVECILNKADGVFLWITLALRRLRNGFIALETVEELVESLEKTPSELNDLFKAMWDRLTPDDQERYQKAACFVFRCLVEWNDVRYIDVPHRFMTFQLALCRVGSSEAAFTRCLKERETFFEDQEFLQSCIIARKQVESHCAGLVEFSELDHTRDTSPLPGLPNDDPRILMIDLVHRSLRDYLLTEGQALLEHPNVEEVFAALFKACIANAMISPRVKLNGLHHRCEVPDKQSLLNYEYSVSHWLPNVEISLFRAVCFYRCWLEYLHQERKNGEDAERPTLWHASREKSLLMISDGYKHHGMGNFIEDMTTWLGDIDSAITATYNAPPAYLAWEILYRFYCGQMYGYLNKWAIEKVYKALDLDFAYPHTLMACCHAIPQLLTLPESWVYRSPSMGQENMLRVLGRLKRDTSKVFVSSLTLNKDTFGNFGSECGVAYRCQDVPGEHFEIIFRISAATAINRFISKRIASRDVDDESLSALSAFLCPSSEESTEVLAVGSCTNKLEADISVDEIFERLGRATLHPLEYKQNGSHAEVTYFKINEDQSRQLSTIIDPNFLGRNLAGPYDACACRDCRLQTPVNDDCKEKFEQLKQGQVAKLKKMNEIVNIVTSGVTEPVEDILKYIRVKGHYVPTEEDLLAFLNADSTSERVNVLDRMNREKSEQESWMLSS